MAQDDDCIMQCTASVRRRYP